MENINVTTVNSKSELKKFLKMAWPIYKNDKNWVPPLMFDKMKLLNKDKNPFFEHAEMELFMAIQDDKIVGRIGAIINHLHNKEHNDKVGFFGFFECVNDQKVANILFDTAKDWLINKGCDAMRGPANPSVNDEYGLLVDGFDDPARLLMTYNPKYYLDLIDGYGFKKAKDLYAYKISSKKMLKSEKLIRVSEIASKRYNFNVRPLNMKAFDAELDKIKFVYNKAWESNWGFVPLTDKEMDHMAADLKPLVDPSITIFGEIDGKTIGFALTMPDYNFVFKEMNGKLLPFNWIKLFTKSKKIPWARVIILGVIPEYQRKGLDSVLYMEILKRAAKRGIHYGEASWILEDNEMMNRGAEVMKGEKYKTYRIYEKPIS